MQRLKLSDRAISAIDQPLSGYDLYEDTQVRYLCLRVTSNGGRHFYYRRRHRARMIDKKLGTFGALSLEEARKLALDASTRIARNEDPFPHGPPPTMPFAVLFSHYLESYAKPNKRTWAEDQRKYRVHLAERWATRPSDSIRKMDVLEILNPMINDGQNVSANRLMSLVKKVFRFANDVLELRLDDPTAGMSKRREQPRRRYMSDDEVGKILRKLDELVHDEAIGMPMWGLGNWPMWRDYFLILLFSGGRKTAVCRMKWADIDFQSGTWTIPAADSKNKDDGVVVLVNEVVEILRKRLASVSGPWVFPSAIPGQPIQEPKRAWARVCKDAGIENAHIHDLRRTLATKQLQLGAPMAVIRDSLTQKDIRVTERAYAHVRSDAVRDSVSKAVSDLNEKR